jgi:hypothetical protein
MIVEFDGSKVGVGSPHYISSFDWRVELVDGLNDIPDEAAEQLMQFEGIDAYLKSGAIAIRQTPATLFERRTELEALYESQGYQAIADIAIGYGIAKPKTGWRDAISLILEYERSINDAIS